MIDRNLEKDCAEVYREKRCKADSGSLARQSQGTRRSQRLNQKAELPLEQVTMSKACLQSMTVNSLSILREAKAMCLA